jgi:hypothetical protein
MNAISQAMTSDPHAPNWPCAKGCDVLRAVSRGFVRLGRLERIVEDYRERPGCRRYAEREQQQRTAE